MSDAGLRAVTDPGPLLLGDRWPGVPGSAVVPVLQGRRALLVEVQALLGPGAASATRRAAARPRASTRRRAICCWPCCLPQPGSVPATADVFVAAVGGIAVTEPAADLGVALALASVGHRPSRAAPTWWCSASSAWAARSGRCPGAAPAPGRGATARASRRAARARVRRWTRARRSSVTARASPCTGVRTLAEALERCVRPVGRSGRRAGRVRCPGGRPRRQPALNDALALIAPGTTLREGLDRILQAKHGALIVVGDDPDVLSVCTGGFLLDAEFTPAAPVRAGQDGRRHHPGRRRRPHRPGQRAPRAQADHPHLRDRHPPPHRRAGGPLHRRAGDRRLRGDGDHRRLPQRPQAHDRSRPAGCIDRASQALPTSQRFRAALRRRAGRAARPRDRGHRLGARRRLGAPAGRDGPPHRRGDRGPPRRARLRRPADPPPARGAARRGRGEPDAGRARLHRRRRHRATCARCPPDALDGPAQGRGRAEPPGVARPDARRAGAPRLPAAAPAAPAALRDTDRRLVEHFGSLPEILSASAAELEEVEGVGAATARHVRDGLARLVEASILERYE